MTHEEFQQQIEAIPNLELAEKAHSALSKLCSSGGASFTMTVPPRLDDTDMILSEVIKRFELLQKKDKYIHDLEDTLYNLYKKLNGL